MRESTKWKLLIGGLLLAGLWSETRAQAIGSSSSDWRLGEREIAAASVPAPAQVSDHFLLREGLFLGALAIDYRQTRSIHNFCNGRINCTVHETNPFLGVDPSRSRIRNYFALAALSHLVIASSLPADWQSKFQMGTLALELVVVGRNKHLGLRTSF